jgi:threonine synthase
MSMVEQVCREGDIYLLNSVNPWRIEGQKTICFELLQDLGWTTPDWIALPAGNLGNTSAFGKALREARAFDLVTRTPRLLSVQAAGASPFHRYMQKRGDAAEATAGGLDPEPAPETVATAIRIGAPRSWRKAARALAETNGRTEAVTDDEILDAKAAIDAAGIGCEPASAASVAGVRKVVRGGGIAPSDRVVCVLTGHLLKDPDTVLRYHRGELEGGRQNRIERAPADPDRLLAMLRDGA